MKPLIKLSGLTKSFGNKEVLKDISLDIYEGEILGLIGKSGCGKSTMIKILVGYHTADSGEIIFEDLPVKDFHKIKQLVGYTTQENSFYEKLTVEENMGYYANLYGLDTHVRKARINKLLRDVKLDSSRETLAGDVSGGMKRRLDFAISLIHEPKLVILDEPTTGLDPILVDNFWQIIKGIVKENKITVLVSSHILSEIKENCDRVAVMSNGKISKIIDVNKNTDIEKEFRKAA